MNVTSELDRLHVIACNFIFLYFLKLLKIFLEFAIYCASCKYRVIEIRSKNIVMHLNWF